MEEIRKLANKITTLARKIQEADRLSLMSRSKKYKEELFQTNQKLQEKIQPYENKINS